MTIPLVGVESCERMVVAEGYCSVPYSVGHSEIGCAAGSQAK